MKCKLYTITFTSSNVHVGNWKRSSKERKFKASNTVKLIIC